MRLNILLNPASGSVPEDGAQQVTDFLNQQQVDYELFEVNGETLLETVKRLTSPSRKNDHLVVWGGDGTICCALSHQTDDSSVILPLPGGTMNMLPKAVHKTEMDWQSILARAIENPVETKISRGKLRDKYFYVGALFGKLTLLTETRETARDEGVLTAVKKTLETHDVLDLSPELIVSSENGEPKRASAFGVFLDSQNPCFDVGAISPDNVFDLTGMALSALMDDWRRTRGVDRLQVQSLTLEHTTSAPVSCTLDGERMDIMAPVDISFEKDANRVLIAT